jgi:2,3-bisphosphoglycerate-dependent phosphoglycerate mutase
VIILVRHAEAVTRVVGGPSEAERPLSETGARQADALVEPLVAHQPTMIVSSPYRRAVDTVVPTARALALDVSTIDELREWDDGFATVDDWRSRYDRCWVDPHQRYGDGESHHELSIRANATIMDLLARSEAGPVIAAGHGTWIARGLETLGAPASPAFWAAMPNPAIYLITRAASTIEVSGPGLTSAGR